MDFYRRMELVCEKIPYGKAATYGQIAMLCGKPRNARQVGFALSHRQLEEVPAHRIVNSQGFLSGAAAFSVPGQQKAMLEAEGVRVSPENRVNLKRDGWKNSLEDARQLRETFEQLQI